jgi:hypothetical protein
MKKAWIVFSVIIFFRPLVAQVSNESVFRQVEIRIDTAVYTLSENSISDANGSNSLVFVYDNENPVAEVALSLKKAADADKLTLQPSGDYEILDSLYLIKDQYKFKVRFKNLTESGFLKFVLSYYDVKKVQTTEEIHLFPCTQTSLSFTPGSDELFIGEEKTFDLLTNNPENIRFSGEWSTGNTIDYRLIKKDDQLRLSLVPNMPGQQKFCLSMLVRKPSYDPVRNGISYQLRPIDYVFDVKTSRLKFLSADKREITLDDASKKEGVEIILDNTKLLEMNKTYRLENQEGIGGMLVAEIFTRNAMENNKVLCLLRAYNYHRTSDGYLYIKDGDKPVFITNFNITPKTAINRISVLREGRDWVPDLSLFPGETVEVKIEGESLHKAHFYFEDLQDITDDSLIRSETEAVFRLKVPLDITKRRIALYNASSLTGYYMNIREYELPRPFDYVYINYGDISRVVSNIRGPILYDRGIKDMVISFNTDKIDDETKLYGLQKLQIELKIIGPKNELIDMRTLDNIVVCPSIQSPRYAFYDKRNCATEDISINKYIRRNTNDLEDWSRIDVTIRHDPSKYGNEGQQKEVEVILKKNFKLDIDVSFPAGLITVSPDKENQNRLSYGNLYGISMAMVAQMSFYHPDKIAKLRPYRIGAGFLALDAFNFQSDVQDLAFVILASIFPSNRERKLSFPLYVGWGYQFKAQNWMLLVGPGISLKL